MEVQRPTIENMLAFWILSRAVVRNGMWVTYRRKTYIEGIYVPVELVDANILYSASPMLAVLPHENGLLEVVVARAEESPANE